MTLEAGEQVLVLLGQYWYPGRILPDRKENVYGPKDDAVFVELLNAAEDVMVTPELIKPVKFTVGEKVECGRGGGSYIAGTIVEMKGDKLFVKYS